MSFFDVWTGSKSHLRKLKLEWETKLESDTSSAEAEKELKEMQYLLEKIDSDTEDVDDIEGNAMYRHLSYIERCNVIPL